MNETSIQKSVCADFERSTLYDRLVEAHEDYLVYLLSDKDSAPSRSHALEMHFQQLMRDGFKGESLTRVFGHVIVAIQEANYHGHAGFINDDQAMLASAKWALGIAERCESAARHNDLWKRAVGEVVATWANLGDDKVAEGLLVGLLARAHNERRGKAIADAIRGSVAYFVRVAGHRPIVASIANNEADPFSKEAGHILNAMDHLIKAQQDERTRARDAELVPGLAEISPDSYQRVLASMRHEQELTATLRELLDTSMCDMDRTLNKRCLKGEVKYDGDRPFLSVCYDEDDMSAIRFGDEEIAERGHLKSWADHVVNWHAPDDLRTVVSYKDKGKVEVIASSH